MTDQSPQHLITWKNWPDKKIEEILNLSLEVKRNKNLFISKLALKTLVMLFQKTSTRTRVSFESAMTEMGGHAIFLDWQSSNFQLTDMKYEAAYLSRNSHVIMARIKKHEDLLRIVSSSNVPIINGCCNMYHPCQAMSDMLTILEDRGSVTGANLVYFGVHNNVVNSLMAICSALNVNLTLVCPIAETSAIDAELKDRIKNKGLLFETLNKEEALKEADYVYTDTWVDMEFFNDPAYAAIKKKRIDLMLPYQLNSDLLKDSNAKILHDMPIHAGYEISGDLVESPNSLIYTQAENRMHAQKGILLSLCEHGDI